MRITLRNEMFLIMNLVKIVAGRLSYSNSICVTSGRSLSYVKPENTDGDKIRI